MISPKLPETALYHSKLKRVKSRVPNIWWESVGLVYRYSLLGRRQDRSNWKPVSLCLASAAELATPFCTDQGTRVVANRVEETI